MVVVCSAPSDSVPNSAASPPPLPSGSELGEDGVTDPYQQPFAAYDDPDHLDPALLQTGGVGIPSGSDGLFDPNPNTNGPNRYDTDDGASDAGSPNPNPNPNRVSGGNGQRIVNPSSIDGVISSNLK